MTSRPGLAARFWAYQAVRFPLPGFVPLITAFAFSSAAYSRVGRGAPGFVPWDRFAVGAFTALVYFFMLRVLDEHKDADVDARFRPELPVPSGVISLAELRLIGGLLVTITVAANALLAPALLLAYLVVAIWAALMTREFFIGRWLRAHPTAYLLSHMAVMPAIDLYTTGLDWLAEGLPLPDGLLSFLVVTFLNGVLIEVGRKMRAPGEEREGVDTYTKAWGLRAAPLVWIATLAGSAGVAGLAARATGTAGLTLLVLLPTAVLCAVPALAFLRAPERHAAARTETASQLWPLITYVLLGAAPYAVRALRGA